MSYTKGPWKVVTGTTIRGVNVFSADDFICEVGALNGSKVRDSTIEADARLIAAAPELLEAAYQTVKAIKAEHGITIQDDDYIYDTLGSGTAAAYFSARAAIAKATGNE